MQIIECYEEINLCSSRINFILRQNAHNINIRQRFTDPHTAIICQLQGAVDNHSRTKTHLHIQLMKIWQ